MSSTLSPPRRGDSGRGFLSRRGRKVVLTVHVIASVAWIGVSGCLLALSLTAVLVEDPLVRQAAFLSLGTLATVVSPAVAVAALASGVLISVGTRWGLFRYWWVVISLVATVAMTAAVFFALGPSLRGLAADARAAGPRTPGLEAVGNEVVSAVVAPSVAIVVLSVVAALNVFKRPGRIGRIRSLS